jgi:hypothetical protein
MIFARIVGMTTAKMRPRKSANVRMAGDTTLMAKWRQWGAGREVLVKGVMAVGWRLTGDSMVQTRRETTRRMRFQVMRFQLRRRSREGRLHRTGFW